MVFVFTVEQSLLPLGYGRDKDIRGAPYDFRKGPHELDYWFTDFKNLIEQTYKDNGNSSVILLSHSMGGPMSLLLLHRMTKSWKDKYIRVSTLKLCMVMHDDYDYSIQSIQSQSSRQWCHIHHFDKTRQNVRNNLLTISLIF